MSKQRVGTSEDFKLTELTLNKKQSSSFVQPSESAQKQTEPSNRMKQNFTSSKKQFSIGEKLSTEEFDMNDSADLLIMADENDEPTANLPTESDELKVVLVEDFPPAVKGKKSQRNTIVDTTSN